ncbi:BA75_03464T0 [Komagataella pastoris]|uniref:BA75_03464T0 n=1 Tax=Komagataella pastoris TaxID=4922 RepID=A0A1B2JEN9_PICPA|nr:BA75_03464T0 [Komagataella pastoris]
MSGGRISKLSSYTRSYRSPAVEFRRTSGNSTVDQPETAINKAMNALKSSKFRKPGRYNSSRSRSGDRKNTTERETNEIRKKSSHEQDQSLQENSYSLNAKRKSEPTNSLLPTAKSLSGGSQYKLQKKPQPPLREVYDVDQELMRYSDSDSDSAKNDEEDDDDQSDDDDDEIVHDKLKQRNSVDLFVFSGSSDEEPIEEVSPSSDESDTDRLQQIPRSTSVQKSRLKSKKIPTAKKLKTRVAQVSPDIETVDLKESTKFEVKSNGNSIPRKNKRKKQDTVKQEEKEVLFEDEDEEGHPVRRVFKKGSMRSSSEQSSDYSSDSDVQIIDVRPASSSEVTRQPKHRRLRMLRHSTLQTRRGTRRS